MNPHSFFVSNKNNDESTWAMPRSSAQFVQCTAAPLSLISINFGQFTAGMPLWPEQARHCGIGEQAVIHALQPRFDKEVRKVTSHIETYGGTLVVAVVGNRCHCTQSVFVLQRAVDELFPCTPRRQKCNASTRSSLEVKCFRQ